MKLHTLHDLPVQDRPRERLQHIGVENLSLQELLALIIEKGHKDQPVFQISQNLLSSFGSLSSIKKASLEELVSIPGVGFATACKLKAVFELGERVGNDQLVCGKLLETPRQIFQLVKKQIADKKREHFLLVSLTSRSQLISVDTISVGDLTRSLATPREVFASALARRADSVILVHNHPSGQTEPSSQDLEITARMTAAGEILGVKVKDHVIIAQSGYVSLAQKGLL